MLDAHFRRGSRLSENAKIRAIGLPPPSPQIDNLLLDGTFGAVV